jgi:mitogen-activated protein kinase 7
MLITLNVCISLSAGDRETLERSKEAAKANEANMHEYNPNRNSSIAAAAAAPTQSENLGQMDVDALERELGGGI